MLAPRAPAPAALAAKTCAGSDCSGARHGPDSVVIFVSDVHLTLRAPHGLALFDRFLDEVATGADRMYILGDLFDVWVHRRQASVPEFGRVFGRIRDLAAAGIPVFFVPGNRDYALNDPFAASQGLTILPDVAEVTLPGRRVLVTHGDLLCTRDAAYHRMRRFLRSRLGRGLLGAMPLRLALKVAGGFRWASVKEVARKTPWQMTIDFDEARRWFAPGVSAIICGHLHRGGIHRVPLGDRDGEIVVLPGWEEAPGYAAWRGGAIQIETFPSGK